MYGEAWSRVSWSAHEIHWTINRKEPKTFFPSDSAVDQTRV